MRVKGRRRSGFSRIPVALTATAASAIRFIRDAVADLSEGGLYLPHPQCARADPAPGAAWRWRSRSPMAPVLYTLVGAIGAGRHRDARLALAKGLGVSFAEESDTQMRDKGSQCSGFLPAAAEPLGPRRAANTTIVTAKGTPSQCSGFCASATASTVVRDAVDAGEQRRFPLLELELRAAGRRAAGWAATAPRASRCGPALEAG